MPTIYPLAQTLFVNKQAESSEYKKTQDTQQNEASQRKKVQALEGEFIKTGDLDSFLDAEEIFARANQYTHMTNNAQNGLQAYTSSDLEIHRAAVRQLMGVDLYA